MMEWQPSAATIRMAEIMGCDFVANQNWKRTKTTMIYALCTNPQVDWLTDGKRYEVLIGGRGWFYFVDDNASPAACYWNGSSAATWERIEETTMTEETEAPQWALDEAVRFSFRYPSYKHFRADPYWVVYDKVIRGHALTIAKHEHPPLDPDLEKAREFYADEWANDDEEVAAEAIIDGAQDHSRAIRAIKAAIKWARSNTKEPIQ